MEKFEPLYEEAIHYALSNYKQKRDMTLRDFIVHMLKNAHDFPAETVYLASWHLISNGNNDNMPLLGVKSPPSKRQRINQEKR
jgi:hypothetical protein